MSVGYEVVFVGRDRDVVAEFEGPLAAREFLDLTRQMAARLSLRSSSID
jgi:phage FluMu protein gp41